MLGRLQYEDARDRTIRVIQGRYNVDRAQAERVENTALKLLRDARKAWGLKSGAQRRYLAWAAQLHEVGLDIAHAKYHQHGGYLVANADLPGFVSFDQRILSILISQHRRKIDDMDISDLSEDWREKILRLVALFRLAVLLNRSRSSTALPEIELRAATATLTFGFPEDWLDNNPLTKADLKQEIEWLRPLGVELRIEDVGGS